MILAYVRCLLCSMNKPFISSKYPTGVFEIPPWEGDPADTPFIMFMTSSPGPGRGRHRKIGGWTKTGALSLGEALADPEFRQIAEDYKTKLISLVKAYLENGVFTLEELS